MTSEELERAIDFLLKSQATLEARIEQVNTNLSAQIARTNEQLTRTNEQLARTNEQLARTDEQLARTDEQIARTDEQLAQTNGQLGEFADTQAEFIRVMTSTWEAQGEFNNSMRTAYRNLAQKIDELVDAWGNAGRG
ncbi:MAG TPA: hypothetical protein VFS10_06460 [Pyrinomonadaceae bacterium]|nr:hypothetical protein [Pyrinomonadaceae bacterium]